MEPARSPAMGHHFDYSLQLLAELGSGFLPMSPEPHDFGRVDGHEVELFRLRNANGVQAGITNYGATLTSLRVPDRDGRFADVVLGFDRLAPYVAGKSYFGAVIGRVA